MEVIVTLKKTSPKEYFLFRLYHAKKRLILIPLIGIAVITLFYLVLYIITGPVYWPPELLTYYVVYVIFMAVVLPAVNILRLRAAVYKQFRTGTQTETTLHISEEGIHLKNELGEARLPWSKIYKTGETKISFRLYVSSAQAMYIPKQYLLPGQEETLRALLKTCVPNNRPSPVPDLDV
jgi:hypothetical protein